MTGRARLQTILCDFRVALGGGLLLLVLAAALLAPLLAPHDPNEQDLLATLQPAFWLPGGSLDYPLGTDALGRCILSRLIYSARVALLVGVSAAIGAGLIGSTLALLAGYCGGRIDWTISRAVDVWMSFPAVVLTLVIVVALSAGLRNMIIAIVLVGWTRFCRVVRSEIIGLMKRDYIAAARIAGASHLQVILRDLLPGAMPVMLTLLSLELGIAVVVEAIISFIGHSAEAHIPTWGGMIADGLVTVFQEPLGLIFPICCIIMTVLGANLLGDGLRRQLDPRLLSRTELAA